jgi:hypothetical protein
MLLAELYAYFGSWASLSRNLGFGSTTYQYWRRIGYIPYPTQVLIEKKTDRMFLADRDHGRK